MKFRAALSTLLIVAGLTGPAMGGPSFDCHTNKGLVEQVICANADLADLDSEMSQLYFTLANDSSGSGYRWVKQTQITWLRQRNACGANVSCLRYAYEERINELKATIAGH